MWDTSKDYRLLIAEKSVDLFKKTIESKTFKGHWNKKSAIQNANSINKELQTLLYSYIEPKDLILFPLLLELDNYISNIEEDLGGENWDKKFSELSSREDKEKTEENIAKIKFFINIIKGLKDRISLGAINDPIISVDIVTGETMSVSKHSTTSELMVCNVNIKNRAITVVTNDMKIKENMRVGVSLLPPTNFMGITSEGMFLGNKDGLLKNVKGELGKMPEKIDLDSLNNTRELIESFLK